MATLILIAHTGQRLEVDTAQFSTIDDLKAWVARKSSIPTQSIIALTPQGRSAKFASLHAEKEIYVYDLRVTQPSSSSHSPSPVSEVASLKRYNIPTAPNSIEDVQFIQSWQELYKKRRAWSMQLLEDCARLDETASVRYGEMDVMIRCLDAAVANLELSIKQLEPKYEDLKKWVGPALEEHEQLATRWQLYLDLARNTPISPALAEFMTRGNEGQDRATLEDLIEPETTRKACKLATTANKRFSQNAADLDQAASQMFERLESLIREFDGIMGRSVLTHSTDSSQLLQDIESYVQQIDADYQAALGYGGTQKDLAQASKTASNHTERLVPNLKKRAKEMDEMVQYATLGRNTIAAESVKLMRTITDITSLHGGVKAQINSLGQSNEDMATFDYLRLIHQLPYMYASFLVEAIRRQDWMDKVKTDSSTLANEMALFQDEESKRRRKWQKMVGSMYGPSIDTNVTGLEVNLVGDENQWPNVSKDELDVFLDSLRGQDTDQNILDDVTKLVDELNAPTKQQSKRLKAFKNGSIHDATLGRSGLMIRGDDELLRSLQDDKGRLEGKLKTAESRVRRLEDLLHRQSQASRPSSLFQPQSPQPNVQTQERRGSVSTIRSPRPSSQHRSSDGADPLLRRIAQLEAELREEKDRASRLEKDAQTQSSQSRKMQNQMQDANSTKKDLLENMEALKREFDGERKSLEDEIKTLKARIEDTEDEIDHFGESREHERTSYDQKVQTLEAEVAQLDRERKDDILKAEGQVDFLRKENRMQREHLEIVERDLQIAKDERRDMSKKLHEVGELAKGHGQVMEKLHQDLSPQKAVPQQPLDLSNAVGALVGALLTKVENTETDMTILRSEQERTQVAFEGVRSEFTEAVRKLSAEEEACLHLREALEEEKAKVSALEEQVADENQHLKQLQAKIAVGETGSETLHKRLAEGETKITTLAEQLASRQSQVGSLEEELHMFKDKHASLQAQISKTTERYGSRDERTKDLTQMLYSQNDRLSRLLDRMGYAVSRSDGQMIITKVPRAERSVQNPNDSSDPGNSNRRSVSLSGKGTVNESADLGLLYWMDAANKVAEDEKYESFIKTLGSFDVDLFADTIYYRVKETEHKARKWQRDAKGYRDRAHAVQKDAHDKIAFRHFKEGDLALFLPTRNQQAGAWAAFNVGFPHYFLREQEGHKLRQREWLVARISRIQERVVDLSKNLDGNGDVVKDDEDDNPFQLSDGLRWYLIDATEDKGGAPSTPGMGKSTVAANNVEATASIHAHAAKGKGRSRDSVASIEGINKTLSKSLESRRSSSASKKAMPFAIGGAGGAMVKGSALASETNSLKAAAPETPLGASPSGLGKGGDRASISRQSVEESRDSLFRAAPEGSSQTEQQQKGRSDVATIREDSMESQGGKKSIVWDPLWSVDYSYENAQKE